MDGQNSIIIVGGANMRGWTEKMSDDELEIVRNADGVLLQREIPDSINIQVAKISSYETNSMKTYPLGGAKYSDPEI
ncbi:hypothetical protein YC2023_015265 [Brassica napus]